MREIALFVEDFGHEEFLNALLQRVAEEHGIEAQEIGDGPRLIMSGNAFITAILATSQLSIQIGKIDLERILSHPRQRQQEISPGTPETLRKLRLFRPTSMGGFSR